MSDVVVLELQGVKKWFILRSGLSQVLSRKHRRVVKAVDGINFTVHSKEIFGIVGESGCGKSTTSRLAVRLLEPTDGKIIFLGQEITHLKGARLRKLRRDMQIVFQDPYSSLNPRMTVRQLLNEPLLIHGLAESKIEMDATVKETLISVGLSPPETFLPKFPHEMSGGQRQRVAIARALITRPKFVVFDEPVSMLDVSIRAGILSVLDDLRNKYELSQIFITHDLAVARQICNRIAVMYWGKIVELGPTEEVISHPYHPYTKALLSAVPVPDPDVVYEPNLISGDIPSALNPPTGCAFHPRCPVAIQVCQSDEPELIDFGGGHYASCFVAANDAGQKRSAEKAATATMNS